MYHNVNPKLALVFVHFEAAWETIIEQWCFIYVELQGGVRWRRCPDSKRVLGLSKHSRYESFLQPLMGSVGPCVFLYCFFSSLILPVSLLIKTKLLKLTWLGVIPCTKAQSSPLHVWFQPAALCCMSFPLIFPFPFLSFTLSFIKLSGQIKT